MSRVLDFADGFTSLTAPTLPGIPFFQSFTVVNTASAEVFLNLDPLVTKTVFCDFELIREDNNTYYKQEGSFIMAYDGGDWNISFGNFTGVDMVRDPSESIAEDYEIKLSMNSGGDLLYDSGTMGALYSGTFKLNITRVLA